jgi:hypothetical protein
MYDDFESYRKNTALIIDHFYEKLLLLKERAQPVSGKWLKSVISFCGAVF